MRSLRLIRQPALLLFSAVLVSCGREPTAPAANDVSVFGEAPANIVNPGVVISQVYGGGGNSGATFTHDFIELFNNSAAPVNIGGWRVSYASAAGTSWTNFTNIPAGTTLQPGQYYLVQQASNAAVGSPLPTPDATGSINMSGTAGKVWLTNASATLPAVACPLDASVMDHVSYGTAASNCEGFGTTATLSNTTAATRNAAGCAYSSTLSADFTAATPTPRNTATTLNPCTAPQPIVTVAPASASVAQNGTQQFTATESLGGSPITTTFTWTTNNPAVATVDANGLATGVAPGSATITATAADGKFGTATLAVTSPVIATVTLTPATASGATGSTQQYTAVARDAGNNVVTTAFTWSSNNAAIAAVDANGLVTAGATPGTATITATAPNAVAGNASFTTTPPMVSYSGQIVISQVYGGGGNAGALYTNDFIELFNRGTTPVVVNGWSVQRSSAGGTSWDGVAPLSGTIQPGQYYLVQQAAGAGGTQALPTPDAVGTGAMGATSGKVILAQTTTPFAVACPTGVVVVDVVAYGSGTNCGNAAPAPSNTTADLRLQFGCKYTPNPTADFVTGAPTPRNSASPTRSCVAGPLDKVAVTTPISVFVGATSQLAPEALDANDLPVTGATFSYASSDDAVATVSASGLVTAVSSSGSPATITVTAVHGGITRTADVEVNVTNPGGINWIEVVFVRSSSMPPGFQTEMAVRAREANGGTIIPATFTYESLDAANLSATPIPNLNSSALLTALAPTGDGSKPRVKVTATPIAGGASYSFTLRPITVEVPMPAGNIYGFNDAFGRPSAAGMNPNDFLIQKDQFTLSYNTSRGTPNWVAYELDSRHMVTGADRCNCFAADPALPAASQIFLYDYTNGGYDRGHMARSADRTAGNVDNAVTFYMTNMVPQFNDLNSGPWAQFENMLGDSARVGGRAVHIVTGPLYTTPLRFVNNAGKVAIPDFTWKVALIGPRNAGIPFSSVSDWNDIPGLTVLAVKMPNVTGIFGTPPLTYLTTVEALEQETGYDLFSLLAQGMQNAIQYKDRAPTAAFAVTGTQAEGSVLTFDASASADPDLGRTDLGGRTEGLTYSWSFTDGSTATGKIVTRTFANDGTVGVTLTVTDVFGWPATSTSALAIANVAPAIAAFAGATILPGETYSANGSFSDPGADTWTATVNYGDASGTNALSLTGQNFTLSHTYAAAGTFTVTVTVNDGAVTTNRTATVVVLSIAAAVAQANNLIDSFGLNNGNANSLKTKLDNALKSFEKGNTTPAVNQLSALLNEINAFEASGKLTPAQAAALRTLVERIRASISA
jgi:DNA/RNA endonuclease G (NUC1)/uncharacterized protein YjdB